MKDDETREAEAMEAGHKLSVVVPAYNEEGSIEELCRQVFEAVGSSAEVEVLIVDDGSTDATAEVARRLHAQDERVRLVVLRGNHGKATALAAGFAHSTGDIVITMDADLQDDPAEIPRFVAEIERGYDLVSGWKVNRLDAPEKTIPSRLYNRVTARLSGIELHDFDCGFKAYRREVVDCLRLYGEYHRYIPVLAKRQGFRIGEISVHHRKRECGVSKYGFERYLRGFFDSMTSTYLLRFADSPMYLFGRVGLAGFAVAGTGLALAAVPVAGRRMRTAGLAALGVGTAIGVSSFLLGFMAAAQVDLSKQNEPIDPMIAEVL